MKVLMENKKKQIAYVALFVICLGLMGWIWVPKFTQKSPVIDSSVIADALNANGSAAGVPGAQSLLPFGESFNIKILNDARFRALLAPKPLTLDPLEVGRDNPFLPPETVLSIPSSTNTATTTSSGE